MEDVLEVYQRPHDPKRVLVCLDEACKQLTSSTHDSLLLQPGKPERVDYEYKRHGQANLFMLFAPLEACVKCKFTRPVTPVIMLTSFAIY